MNEVNGHKKNGLPKGWEWIELGKLCEKISKIRTTGQDQEREFFYLDIGSIDNTENKIIGHKTYKWKDAPSRAQQIVQKDDVLFSTVRTYLKNIALVDSSLYNNQIASSGFTVLRGKKGLLHPKFLFYRTISNDFLEPLNKLQTGSSYPAVRDKDVLSQEIPIPPYDVQQQIVSKIEELFSELDKSIEQLKTTQQQLKVYRQSVLKRAFEGKLTNENLQGGQLPKGWQGKKLKEVGNAIDPQPSHRTPPVSLDGIPYVSTKDFDFENDQIDFSGARRVSKQVLQEHLERYELQEGDFVIGKIGTIGNPVRIVLPQNYTLSANIVLIQPRTINRKFLYYFFKTNHIEREFQKGSKATTQAAFGIQKVRELEIPYPQNDEQQLIVHEIESRLSVADKLEKTITNSLQQAEALRQSILKKAFEGKLL